jgi:hypothetical protein
MMFEMQNLGCKELEECSVEWRRMANDSEEGQGLQMAVVPVMMMMMMMKCRGFVASNI